MNLRSSFHNKIKALSDQWEQRQNVFLGNDSEVVSSGIPSMFYARQNNDRVILVYNGVNTPPIPNLQVVVGVSRDQPKLWQIINVRDMYLEPASQGQISYHAAQHMIEGGDRVPIDRKQLVAFSILPANPNPTGFMVNIYGGLTLSPSGYEMVVNQQQDLSAYAVSIGAKYVTLEVANDGTLSFHEGEVFASKFAGTTSDMPIPSAGKRPIAVIVFYEGQTSIQDSDIYVLMPLASAQVLEWGNIGGDINDQPDLANLLHEHENMRWGGTAGQDTFEFAEIVTAIEQVIINGVVEDVLDYSLSEDGTQLLLDNALESDSIVSASLVLA